MDNEIKKLRPFFYSIREVKGNALIDLLIPTVWKHDILNIENVKVIEQDTNDVKKLVSIITNIRKENDTYNVIFDCANKIIKYNIEEEEKQRLFKEKMKELEDIFKNTDLDKLKQIKFTENEGQISMVGNPDGEGPEGDRGTQEEVD